MSRILEAMLDLVLGAVGLAARLKDELHPRRWDDPYTLAKKQLNRAWTRSFAAAVIASLLALVLDSLLVGATSMRGLAGVVEPLRQWTFLAVATVLVLSALHMSYCGYRLWKLEHS